MERVHTMSGLFNSYKKALIDLPTKCKYEKRDLLTPAFLMQGENDLKVFFAAHNEYINLQAKVIIVGITPGWTQMEKSIRLSKFYLEQGVPQDKIVKRVKAECRFIGSMRNNLIEMLEELELHKSLNIPTTKELFSHYDHFLHTVSLIKYPVFQQNRNYTGHSPPIQRSKLLTKLAKDTVKSDIIPLKDALIIPLGKAVESFLTTYIEEGRIRENQCLLGFPHPSGANGHRHRQFQQKKDKLKEQIHNFLC